MFDLSDFFFSNLSRFQVCCFYLQRRHIRRQAAAMKTRLRVVNVVKLSQFMNVRARSLKNQFESGTLLIGRAKSSLMLSDFWKLD